MRVLRHLESAAIAERDERVRDYPGFVERKLVAPEDAAADIQAWTAIARWCAGEEDIGPVEIDPATLLRWDGARAEIAARRAPLPDMPDEWEIMELAAEKALRHLDRLRAAKPDDAGLAARRARVDAIVAGLHSATHFFRRREQSRLRAWRAAMQRFPDAAGREGELVTEWLAVGAVCRQSTDGLWTDLARASARLDATVYQAASADPGDASLARMRIGVAEVADMLDRILRLQSAAA